MDQNKIYAWCDAHRAEQLALLKELAAVPSPSHHEEKRADSSKPGLKRTARKT